MPSSNLRCASIPLRRLLIWFDPWSSSETPNSSEKSSELSELELEKSGRLRTFLGIFRGDSISDLASPRNASGAHESDFRFITSSRSVAILRMIFWASQPETEVRSVLLAETITSPGRTPACAPTQSKNIFYIVKNNTSSYTPITFYICIYISILEKK